MSGTPLPRGWKVVLNDIAPSAKSCVDAGRGDVMLYAQYVGQENTGTDSIHTLSRAWTHAVYSVTAGNKTNRATPTPRRSSVTLETRR